MSDKRTYTPGAIASFFATHSSESGNLKEQKQIRSIFEGSKESKSLKSAKTSAPESPKIRKKAKKSDGTDQIARNTKSKDNKKSQNKGENVQKEDSASAKKSRKRSLSETTLTRSDTGSSQSNVKLKRVEENAADVEPGSADSAEVPKKNETVKLSKNELNAKRRVDFKQKKENLKEQKTRIEQTIFVGNVALTVTKKTLMRLFKPFGKVEAVRIRSVPVAKPEIPEDNSRDTDRTKKKLGKKAEKQGSFSVKDLVATEEEEEKTPKPKRLPKRALVIMKEFDPKRHSMNAYVVFETEESAREALQLNGTLLEGLHIRVDMAGTAKKHDNKLTMFIGNLPFDIEEEDVRKHFDVCGEIENVRIVRDKFTGSGKGFGYVKFTDKSSCNLALSLDGQELRDRPLRVKKAAKKLKAKKVVDPASKTFPRKKIGSNNVAQGKRNVKQEKWRRSQGESGAKKASKLKTGTKQQSKSQTKAVQKFGDLKHRLQSMKMNTKGGRKEKHGLKKAFREMIRERKKTSLGKLLTGEKKKQQTEKS